MVLERGVVLIGSSRSGYTDFKNTVDFLASHPDVVEYLQILVGSVNEVRNLQDIINAFEKDLSTSWGKTVMEWKI